MGRKLISNFKKISGKFLTLSYSRYRLFIFLFVLIFLRFLPFSVVERTHDLSICYKLLGDYCYSVGITRGVSSILRGHIAQGIEYNFLAIPVLLILIGFMIHDYYKGFIKYKG